MKNYLMCLCLSCLIFVLGNAHAREPLLTEEVIGSDMHDDGNDHVHGNEHGHHDHDQAGTLTGSIQIGVFLENTDSQLKADSKNATTNTLDEKADDINIVEPFILLDLTYKVNAGVSICLKTPFEDDEYGLAIGVRKDLSRERVLELSVFYGLFDEVWEDPYITNTTRKETDMRRIGGEIRYEHSAERPLNLGYIYESITIDNDLIGERVHDLRREGNVHTGSIGYEFVSEYGHRLSPEMKYIYADMNGKSNSCNEYAVELNYAKMSERYLLEFLVAGGVQNYDKKHPLFDKKRKDNIYKTELMFIWLKPFGLERNFVTIGMEIESINSNIDFFDSRTLACFALIGYEL